METQIRATDHQSFSGGVGPMLHSCPPGLLQSWTLGLPQSWTPGLQRTQVVNSYWSHAGQMFSVKGQTGNILNSLEMRKISHLFLYIFKITFKI